MVFTEIDRVTVDSFIYKVSGDKRKATIIFDVDFILYEPDEMRQDLISIVRHELHVDNPVWESMYDLSTNILYELIHTYPGVFVDPETPIVYPDGVWDSLRRYFKEEVV